MDKYEIGLIQRVETLKNKLIKCEEALTFYADPETYFAIGFLPDHPTGEFINDFSETELGYKPGKLARETLRYETQDTKNVEVGT